MTLGGGLKALDAMNNLGLWIIWATRGRKLKAMDIIKNSALWMNERLQISWTHGSRC